jgi:hypothetical protein
MVNLGMAMVFPDHGINRGALEQLLKTACFPEQHAYHLDVMLIEYTAYALVC